MQTQRAAIYARISETDETVDKVANQIEQCQALAAREGYAVVETFADDGISASKFKKRPAWDRLLDRTAAGDFDVILATEEERFTRQPIEKEALLAISADAGVMWHTVRDGRTDPRSAMGEFSAGLRALLGRLEGSRKSERQRSRFESETTAGRHLWGVRPFGFESARGGVLEAEASLIRDAYKAILNGGTLWGVVRDLNGSGIKTTRGNDWTYQTVRQVLLRPRNAGQLISHGEVVSTDLPAIVSVDDLEAVRLVLTDPRRDSAPGPKVLKHFMTGIAVCGVCGSPMVSAQARNKNGVLLIYKCSRKARGGGIGERHPTIQRHELEAPIADAVYSALIAKATRESEVNEEQTLTIQLRRERAEVSDKRDRVQDLMLEPNVNLTRLRVQLAQLSEQIESLDERIATATRAQSVEAVLETVRWLTDSFRELAEQEREYAASDLLTSIAASERFDAQWSAMHIEDKRALVKATLRVTVNTMASTELRKYANPPKLGEFTVVREGGRRLEIEHL